LKPTLDGVVERIFNHVALELLMVESFHIEIIASTYHNIPMNIIRRMAH
jgi:hypothetical protein